MNEAERQKAIQEILERHHGEGVKAQADALERQQLAEPTQPTTDQLWKWLVVGLLGLLAIALIGLIVLLDHGKSYQAILTVFASVLSGLLGLFIKGPGTGNG